MTDTDINLVGFFSAALSWNVKAPRTEEVRVEGSYIKEMERSGGKEEIAKGDSRDTLQHT